MHCDSVITALIRSLESQRYQAMLQGDLVTFQRLAHPALVYVHSNGVKDDLTAYVNKCRNGLYLYQRIDHSVHEVRVCGDITLVFGQMSADIVSHGVAKNLNNLTLSVWLKSQGQWQLTAYHPTPVIARPVTPPAFTQGDLPHVNAPIYL